MSRKKRKSKWDCPVCVKTDCISGSHCGRCGTRLSTEAIGSAVLGLRGAVEMLQQSHKLTGEQLEDHELKWRHEALERMEDFRLSKVKSLKSKLYLHPEPTMFPENSRQIIERWIRIGDATVSNLQELFTRSNFRGVA